MPTWFVMFTLFAVGGIIGFMIAALMAAAGYADEESERRIRELDL